MGLTSLSDCYKLAENLVLWGENTLEIQGLIGTWGGFEWAGGAQEGKRRRELD